jgi:RNA polymerase sigma-70 factor (ECF subfamily)
MDDTSDFETAFAELVSVAYRVGYRLLGDRAAAEDVAQECLARALVNWQRVRHHATPWVVRVATNLALDRVRARKRWGSAAPVEPMLADSSSTAALRVTLARQLASLPRRQRDVVALRYLADLSEAEVAGLLGVSPGAVKRHAHRGLAALRTLLIEGAM